MSLPPVAGAVTMIRTGRVGYVCAQARRDTAGSAAAPAARCRKFRRGSFIVEPPFTSFDHLVGAGEQRGRHGEAEQSRGFEINYQLEPRRLLNGKIGRLGALEDFVDISRCTPSQFREICSVRHKAASVHIFSKSMKRRQMGGDRKVRNALSV